MHATSTAGSSDKYPRAIVHVDGDCFFASCEVAKRPWLKGKPVVVGADRGIAVAMSYEAKALGVTRGLPIYRLKKLFPSVTVLSSSYNDYELYARRMYSIVRRYSNRVEEYSVDECFADITDMPEHLHLSYEQIAVAIKKDLESSLGITFSLGLAPTKVLAKVGSKHRKPSGLVCIPLGSQNAVLRDTKAGVVWGIGRATAERLYRQGVSTALEFAEKPEWWVKETFAKPHHELWQELNGISVMSVASEWQDIQKSIMSTRTFTPPSTDPTFIFAQLSKNIENACRHARERGLTSRRAFCFVKSQDFQYVRFEVPLPRATNIPTEILPLVSHVFQKEFRSGIQYRATGVTLGSTEESGVVQHDLFGGERDHTKKETLYRTVDAIAGKYGKHALMLGSTLSVLKDTSQFEEKPFSLISLGEVD